MRVELLGTGSADRWPNPFCDCPSCSWARRAGALRDRTSVLVDEHLLVDPGPDVGARGRDLTGVDTVLVTHAHPDHLDPAFLLAWTWAAAGSDRSLVVAGPAQAVDQCRHWLAPESPVLLRALRPGEVLTAGELTIRALTAAHSTAGGSEPDGTALLYEVSGLNQATGHARLLVATDTAALPHDELVGPYDVVLMEQTFGDVLDHGTAHLDLPGFVRELDRLRQDRRLAPGARVAAIHLSHHNPPDIAARMARFGVEVVPDGTVLTVGGPGGGRGRRLMITGGARSGKSRRAESLAAARGHVHYVATAPRHDDDPEWVARIDAHRARRPPPWQVSETRDLAAVLRSAAPGQLVLVDCLTLWLTGTLDAADAWDDPDRAGAVTSHALDGLVADLLDARADVVLVTNEVGSGVVPTTASGRLFRDLLGTVNSSVAAACDDVEAVLCGLPTLLKGRPWTC